MTDIFLDRAYTLAREQLKAASLAIHGALVDEFPGLGLDATHQATQRALQLHFAALELTRKVWAGSLPYDKAQDALQKQFAEFSHDTCVRAFADAYIETR
jgi:hypothetical protein